MPQVCNRRILTAIVLLTLTAVVPLYAQSSAAAPTAPDSTLYTTYSGSSINLSWIVCGATQETEGCYDSGSLGPFVGIGAMLESNPTVKGDVVTREVYIVDSGATNDVKLYVYKKTDTVSSTFDTTTITLSKTVSLPLTGGAAAVTSMAANNTFLFIGTNQGEQAVMVQKSNLAVSKVGIYILGINVSSITSDEYGYITVTQVGSEGSGFAVFGPNGESEEDGGGSDFVLGTTQAVSTSLLLGGGAPSVPRKGYRMKAALPSNAR